MILKRVGPPPHDGETRTVRRFAWLPTWCDDGTVRWLEPLHVRQVRCGSWVTTRAMPLRGAELRESAPQPRMDDGSLLPPPP